jgi:hypothetical protein
MTISCRSPSAMRRCIRKVALSSLHYFPSSRNWAPAKIRAHGWCQACIDTWYTMTAGWGAQWPIPIYRVASIRTSSFEGWTELYPTNQNVFCSTDQEIKGTILLVVQSDMCCKMPNIGKHLGTHGLWISIPLVSQGNIHVPNGSRSPSISTALKFLGIPGALRGKNGSNMVQMRMKWMKHPKNCISRRTMIDKPYVSGGAGGTVPSIGKPSRFSHGKGLFCSSFGTSKIGANK